MPFKSKEAQAKWQKENPSLTLQNSYNYRDKLKTDMVNAYGGKCLHCNIKDPEVLVLDHIHDDAKEDRLKNNHTGGYFMYAKLKKLGWPKNNYQLLCHNCNYKKELKRRRLLRKLNNAIFKQAA